MRWSRLPCRRGWRTGLGHQWMRPLPGRSFAADDCGHHRYGQRKMTALASSNEIRTNKTKIGVSSFNARKLLHFWRHLTGSPYSFSWFI